MLCGLITMADLLLSKRNSSMYNTALTFMLKDGAYPGYKRAHDELWPEIAASMSDNDVNMAIYPCGDRMFLHASAPTRKDWDNSREHPALAKWIQYMKQYIVSDEKGNLLFEELDIAFVFGIYAES